MFLYPPVTPGLTTGAEAPEEMQLLATLATMRSHNRKRFEAFFDSVQKLFTPKPPPSEPTVPESQPPASSGQALGSLLGQPGAGPIGSQQ